MKNDRVANILLEQFEKVYAAYLRSDPSEGGPVSLKLEVRLLRIAGLICRFADDLGRLTTNKLLREKVEEHVCVFNLTTDRNVDTETLLLQNIDLSAIKKIRAFSSDSVSKSSENSQNRLHEFETVINSLTQSQWRQLLDFLNNL